MFKSKVLAICNECQNKDLSVSIEIIKQRINESNIGNVRTLMEAFKLHNDQLRQKLGIESTKATVTKYESLYKKVARYIEQQYKRKDIFLKELDHRFVVNFEIFLKTVDRITHNPAIKYIQFSKKITNMSIAHGWITTNPFKNFKCSLKDTDRGFLSADELYLLLNKDIPNRRLSAVRDIFLFSCYTGLAYADVKTLTQNGIVKGVDGNSWINSSMKKTGIRISVPLLMQAQLILSKYPPDKNAISIYCLFSPTRSSSFVVILKCIFCICVCPSHFQYTLRIKIMIRIKGFGHVVIGHWSANHTQFSRIIKQCLQHFRVMDYFINNRHISTGV